MAYIPGTTVTEMTLITRMKRAILKYCFSAGLLLLLAAAASSAAFAQDTPDTVLRPPKGSQVAIIVFEDLQCPMCRRTAPLVEQASKDYKIPVVRHDFPLPMHNWSYEAAIMARYFDTHSKAVGNEFRDYVFQNQLQINPQNLRDWAEKFALDHKIDFPFVLDPGGKFAAEVNADRDLGNAIKINHTPTVYVVSSKNPNHPYVEVKDNTQLYSTIDAVMKE
jgi:protein-disulfide isomerase